MPDEPFLREQARAGLQEGSLPRKRPDRTWGGKGMGHECAVCHKFIASEETELEIEFDHPRVSRFFLHARCYAAWEFERTKLSPAKPERLSSPYRGHSQQER